MDIEPSILNRVIDQYKLQFSGDVEKPEDALALAFKAIEAYLPGYFNWESLVEQDINPQLLSILKDSLSHVYDHTLQFDELETQLSCHRLTQQFNDATQFRLASPPSQQGIQEKFLKSTLTDDENLSLVDIQRHIIQTDMVGHIGVMDANSETMGLHLVNARANYEKQRDLNPHQPYSVAMMVNCNPKAEAQWAAVVITIDPTNNQASFTLTGELAELQKFGLEKKVKEAIDFYDTSLISINGLTFNALPPLTVTSSSHCQADQGTYQILHQLYNADALHDVVLGREHASAFKNTSPDVTSMKRAVTELQIQSIKLEPELFDFFKDSRTALHPFVGQVIQDVKLTDRRITFPRYKPDEPLVSLDYMGFIQLLQQKCDNDFAGFDKTFEALEIKCFDVEALKGLAQLQGGITNLPCDKLIVNLPDTIDASDKATYKFHLKRALLSMSELNLAKLQLNDAGGIFDDSDIAEITHFIEQYKIALDLSLPEQFLNSTFQKHIDMASSQFILDRNNKHFLNRNDRIDLAPSAKPTIRTRPALSSNNLSIDIELEQQVQVEVAVGSVAEIPRAAEEGDQDAEIYGLQDLLKAFKEDVFSPESKSYLLPQNQEGVEKIWCNWLGYFNVAGASNGLKISKTALEEIMRHADKFQYGIGFIKKGEEYRNLPAGFSVKKKEGREYLDFDANLKLVAEKNLLTVQNKDAKPDARLSAEQIQIWINANPDHPFKTLWEEQLASVEYSKNTIQALQTALPIIAQMSMEQAVTLVELSKTDSGDFDLKKFNFLVHDAAKAKEVVRNEGLTRHVQKLFGEQAERTVLNYIENFSIDPSRRDSLKLILSAEETAHVENIQSKIPSSNVNLLIQLYLQSGSSALKDLSTLLNNAGDKLELYQAIIKNISSNKGTYQQFLTPEFQDALKIYSGLPDNERLFFAKLFEQHSQVHSNVNFAELMNTFVQFKQELQGLAQPGQVFTLPSECNLKDVKSMPLALARIVALVRHVKQEDRQAQLSEAHNLDLSSVGMIYAITKADPYGKKWNFITHEMDLTAEKKDHFSSNLYNPPDHWSQIGEPLIKNFFRYVAFQRENSSLSFNFYKQVVEEVETSSKHHTWSEETKMLFCKLVAASTTGAKNTKFTKNTQDAIEAFHFFLEKINNPPTPAFMKQDLMRRELLKTLNELQNVPPLPVLSRLVILIANSMSNLFSALANKDALLAANESLKEMSSSTIYDSAVYEGMQYYRESDYSNGKLFFEHMDTVKAIYEKSHEYVLPSEVWIDNLWLPPVGKRLVQLISSFHLKANKTNPNQDSLSGVFASLNRLLEDTQGGDEKKRQGFRVYEILSILVNIAPEKYSALPTLESTHLIDIINRTIDLDSEFKVLDVIKNFKVGEHSLSEYFNKDFLENYGKKSVPNEVKRKIEHGFDDQVRSAVENILLHFTNNSDANEYGAVVDQLIGMTKDLSRLEKNLFIAKLNQAKGLYSQAVPLNSPNNHFRQLLDSLEQQGSPQELLNLIAKDQSLFASLESEKRRDAIYTGDLHANARLDQKAVYLVRDIYPAVRFNKQHPFSSLEITPRLQEWLLRTPAAQLDQKSKVVHPDMEKTKAYLEQSDEFLRLMTKDAAYRKLDFEALIKELDALEKQTSLPNKESVIALKEKVVTVSKPITVSQSDFLGIINNPPAQRLLKYFSGLMSEEEKASFESEHSEQIAKHPGLNNKALLEVMIDKNNIRILLKKTMQGDSLSALKSEDLLTNAEKFNTFLTALEEDVTVVKALQDAVNSMHQEVDGYHKGLDDYPNVVLFLVDKMAALVNQNQIARGQFLQLFDKFVEQYPQDQGEMMLALHQFFDQLTPVFAMIEDKNIVLSLCMQFNGEEELQPKDLLALVKAIKTIENLEDQRLLINVAVNLLNNDKGYVLGDGSGDDFTKLCNIAKTDPRFITALKTFYEKPPYPDLKQIIKFHNEASQKADYALAIQDQAKQFDIKPCHRELNVNGFNVEKSISQLNNFEGYTADDEKLKRFAQKTIAMRDKSSDELLTLLKAFHPNKRPINKDMETLVAVAAELLYRSKGKDDLLIPEGEKHKPGSSMEINTTQYLAILSSLETPGYVTSQIGTGEGKSRIMMISNVCQWALGNTVDFVTSDAQLATRDYVEYQAYFNMVGAKTSMIFANSDPSAYQIGGINFSDPSNLSLFRNKAKSLGERDKVLDPNEERRALLLDEADRTYFDVADTRFNFSKEGDESIQNMGWVYRLLMEYFEQESVSVDKGIHPSGKQTPQNLFYADADASRQSFLAFAGSRSAKQDYMRLKALSEQQIEQWQVSAVTASQLQFKKDFVIEADQLIHTPKGPKLSSQAQLLFANRVARGSKFSFGVHQCLHARLNRLRETSEKLDNPELKQALQSCEQGFHVDDEKQIVYSSTSKNLIDDYANGTLKAVTGTAGSKIERAEANTLYKGMTFIDVPRDQGMKRHDKGIQLCQDETAQIKAFVKSIKEARLKNQPILIIAENDEASEKLYKSLQKHFPDNIQRIHSQLNSKQEKDQTEAAGIAGMITVSTGMIGRGTDIALQGEAKKNGLNVMLSYLPRWRDLLQILGRAGRFGAKGETSLILDKVSLLKQLGLAKLPKDFSSKADAFIERAQAKMDRKAQVERLIKNQVGDFQNRLTNNFFEDTYRKIAQHQDQKALISCWTEFFQKSDKAWNEIWPHIKQKLGQPNIAEAEIAELETLLSQYREVTQKEWITMTSKVKDLDISLNLSDKKAHECLMLETPNLVLDEHVKSLLGAFKVTQQEVPRDNRFKKMLGGILGFIGVAIGVALIATGFLAPVGIALIVTGVAIGVMSTAADRFSKPETTEVLEINVKEPSSTATMLGLSGFNLTHNSQFGSDRPGPVTPEPVTPEPVTPEPVRPEPVKPEPSTQENRTGPTP